MTFSIDLFILTLVNYAGAKMDITIISVRVCKMLNHVLTNDL